MNTSILIAIVGFGAALCAIFRALPQAVHITLHRTVAGVSQGTWALSFASSCVWITWSIVHANLPNLVANIGICLAATLVLFALFRNGVNIQRAIVLNGIVIVCCLILTHMNTTLLSTAAIILPSIFYLPQMQTALKGGSLAGISPAAWYITLTGIVLWAIYGVAIHSLPIVLPSFICFPQVIVILVCLRISPRNMGGEVLDNVLGN